MRISTSMIFAAGVNGIDQQLALQLKLQQQVAAGRNLLTPADDPVAASQVLQVQQAKDINSQFATNLNTATSALGTEETQFTTTLTDFFSRMTELTVQAQSGTLSTASKAAIAVELRSRFNQLMSAANAKDASGQYLFSGYKGNTQPFSGSVDSLLANPANDITYQGDDGQRMLAISPSSQVAISDSGADVFMRIPSGNGYFTTSYAGGNTGTGIISTGTVTDPAAWAATANKPLTVGFTVAAGVTTYTVADSASPTPNTLATGTYIGGQPIALAGQGISLTVTGAPANGDSFTVAASTSQSVFKTLANLVGTLERTTTTPADQAKYQADVSNALLNFQQASANINRVHATIGSRLNEVTAQQDTNNNSDLQYTQTLSVLEGSQQSDQTKTISDLTLVQTQLQAALKSFTTVSGLSLFNYL